MFDQQVLAFAVVALVLAMTPGPDMALVTRNGLRYGRRAALVTISGIAVGLVGWIAATALGVAALLAASGTVFTVVKIVGGVYLIYLGVQALLAARRGVERTPESAPRGSPFRQGLVTNIFNPKLGVFFTTLLPQFIGKHDPVFAKSLLLAGVFVAIGLTWLVVYAHIVSFAGAFMRRPRVQRAFEAVTGIVLVGLGVRIAFER